MSSDVGIVCGRCDLFNPRDGTDCAQCGNDLTLYTDEGPIEGAFVEKASAEPTEEQTGAEKGTKDVAEKDVGTPGPDIRDDHNKVESPELDELEPTLVAAANEQGVVLVRPLVIGTAGRQEPRSGSEELQMDQARHYICKSCYSPIPGGHKFCGKCGAPTNFTEDYGSTQYFGAMQVPNKAKLILIKGEGLDGISYHLNSTEHVAGRQQGAILFPDDAWLSPRHANFFYRDNKLFVRDEDSLNGVYIRVREPTILRSGQMFMCGEEVFNIENAEALTEGPESDGTYFYASPTKNWAFRVVQLLPNGIEGIVVHNSAGKIVIGREDCDMNFIQDRFMSTKHAEVDGGAGKFTLTDLDSQNGTFVRIDQERELVHGDYVFLGKQLLRVEVTP